METNNNSGYDLFKQNDVFADVINVLAFRGREILNPDDLEDVPELKKYVEENGIVYDDRSIVTKFWRNNAYLCIDTETVQKKDLSLKISAHKRTLYGMQLSLHQDVIHPVFVLVLYYGKTHWNYGLHSKDALNVSEETEHEFND